MEEVLRDGVELLACDGLPSLLLFVAAAECRAFVLQVAHGCLMRACAVRVSAVVISGYALWVATRSLVNHHSALRV